MTKNNYIYSTFSPAKKGDSFLTSIYEGIGVVCLGAVLIPLYSVAFATIYVKKKLGLLPEDYKMGSEAFI